MQIRTCRVLSQMKRFHRLVSKADDFVFFLEKKLKKLSKLSKNKKDLASKCGSIHQVSNRQRW